MMPPTEISGLWWDYCCIRPSRFKLYGLNYVLKKERGDTEDEESPVVDRGTIFLAKVREKRKEEGLDTPESIKPKREPKPKIPPKILTEEEREKRREKQRAYYNRNKDKPEFKAKNNAHRHKWYWANRDKVKEAYQRSKTTSPKAYANLSKEERRERYLKARKRLLEKLEAMTPEEREQWRKKQREYSKAHYNNHKKKQ